MPRLTGDTVEVFRAAITYTTTRTDGTVVKRTSYYGPYSSSAPARARVNSAITPDGYRNAWDKAVTVTTGHVERADTVWVSVDKPPVQSFMTSVPTAEWELLREDAAKLSALRAAGVDNWSGFEYAMEQFYDDEEYTP